MNDKEKLKKLKQLGEKYKTAKEYYENLIECRFVPLPPVAKQLINQCGEQILEIINGR